MAGLVHTRTGSVNKRLWYNPYYDETEDASDRMSKRQGDVNNAFLKKLRAFWPRLSPRAHTKSPWPGHNDLAVNGKTFAYLSVEGEPFSMSVKLPYTSYEALKLPFSKPTGYGLGKSGWD